MLTLLCHALEHRDSLGLRLRLEHVITGEILRLRIAARSDTRCRALQIVERAPQHDLWPKQQPVRPRLPVGHADAARVHDAHTINGAVELHMRVPTDDDPLPDVTPASISRRRSSGIAAVIISSSLRGEPWQKSTSPSPSTLKVACSGR